MDFQKWGTAIATGSEFRETHLNLAKAQSSQRKAGKRLRGSSRIAMFLLIGHGKYLRIYK
jgi:hypothetical protein